MTQLRNKKIDEKQRALRNRLWPEITEDSLWMRRNSKGYNKGFATLPRTMPLMMAIMDDMSKTKPVSSTYLELFCRDSDTCMITLSKPREMAFHAGFTGQRAERTWKERLKILSDLGFIKLKEGPSGPMSYALIMNPYHVIKIQYEKRHPGVTADKYNALMARAIEIGASDLDDPEEPEEETKRPKRIRRKRKAA